MIIKIGLPRISGDMRYILRLQEARVHRTEVAQDHLHSAERLGQALGRVERTNIEIKRNEKRNERKTRDEMS